MGAIGDRAGDRYGVVTSEDLADLGVSRAAQCRWTARGYLRRQYPGVFAVGWGELTVRGQWLAAVLSFRGGAFLSHRSAAELWGFGPPRLPIELTVARGMGGGRARCRVHESRHLAAEDVTIRERIPVTTVARTLIDLAPRGSRPRGRELIRIEDMAVAAIRKGMTTLDALRDMAVRGQSRPGASAFRAMVARLDPEMLATRSHGERLLRRIVRRWNLPAFESNATICGYEVDALWRAERQIVELDGRAYHSDAESFERDRRRDATLQRAGYSVLRISYRMVRDEPEAVADTLRTILAAAAAAGPRRRRNP